MLQQQQQQEEEESSLLFLDMDICCNKDIRALVERLDKWENGMVMDGFLLLDVWNAMG